MEHLDLDLLGMLSGVNLTEVFSGLPALKSMDLSGIFTIFPRQVYYDITLAVSVLSCNEPKPNEFSAADDEDKSHHDMEENESSNFLHSVFSFLNFGTSQSDEPEPLSGAERLCEDLVDFDTATSLSLYGLVCVLTVLLFFTLTCICAFCFRRSGAKSDSHLLSKPTESTCDKVEDSSVSYDDPRIPASDDYKSTGDRLQSKPSSSPLIIKNAKDESGKNVTLNDQADDLFQNTLQRYLKHLDISFGISYPSGIDSGSASMPASSQSASHLASPRLSRRAPPQSRQVASRSQSLTLTDPFLGHIDESVTKSWIAYETFKRRMSWEFPDTNLDSINISHFSQGNENLAMVLQFLHQNCPINPRQWDIATSVVNYSLFILEQELRDLCRLTQDFLQVSRFEPSGSAADGTLIGSADRFDVLLVIDIPSCSELLVLHNNFCEEVPPGHVVLGAKEKKFARQGLNYSRKACVQGIAGLFLQTQSVMERVETLLKKAVLRLSREHKGKLDALPFSLQMSQSKRLVLTLDTRLLQGFGLGLSEISVRITPAVSLNIPEFCLLPQLFAVPVIKSSASTAPPGQSTLSSSNQGALARLFRSTPGFSDLHWLVHTERVTASIVTDIERRMSLAGVRSYHRECMMVLKALFSPSHRSNKLLNKGEVDSYALRAVVIYLLQESPPQAWTLVSLAERVSDCVHFLRRAYERGWLPEPSMHNPHLLARLPALGVMGQLVKGRQRNLLALVSSQGALKVLGHVTHRLHETRLERTISDQFSADMWEYEFFMFG